MYKSQLIAGSLLVLLFVHSSLAFPVTNDFYGRVSRHTRSIREGPESSSILCRFVVVKKLKLVEIWMENDTDCKEEVKRRRNSEGSLVIRIRKV
jgi:hypothetical protein